MIVARSLDELATIMGLDAVVDLALHDDWRDAASQNTYFPWLLGALPAEDRDVLRTDLHRQMTRRFEAVSQHDAQARHYLAQLPLGARTVDDRRRYWRYRDDRGEHQLDAAGVWQLCAPVIADATVRALAGAGLTLDELDVDTAGLGPVGQRLLDPLLAQVGRAR